MDKKTEAELRRTAEEIVAAIDELKNALPNTVGRRNAMVVALACLKVAVEAAEFVIAYDESRDDK